MSKEPGRRSKARRLGWALLLGAAPIALGACGLLIGLEDHQPFPPGADAGPDGALPDVLTDAPDACHGNVCDGVCIDTSAAPTNCGQCGVACRAGFTCDGGVCGETITQISAGSDHGCALLHDGSIWCWGGDAFGQLGTSATKDTTCNNGYVCQPNPARVEGLPGKMVQVAAGSQSTCAVSDVGGVWCWGWNEARQLGRDTPSVGYDRVPQPVTNIPAAAQVTVGYRFACARSVGGAQVHCWGYNADGALGTGKPSGMGNGDAPGQVIGLPGGITDVQGRLGGHVCAVDGSKQVWCWGSNSLGQLGHASKEDLDACANPPCSGTPQVVQNVSAVSGRITTGLVVSCASTTNDVTCWGGNTYGQLEAVASSAELAPTLLELGTASDPSSFTTSYSTSCVIADGSGVACWGDDTWGGLGRGTLGAPACPGGGFCTPTLGAVMLPGGLAPKQLSTGSGWAMALLGDNTILAWGANFEGRIGHLPGTLDDLKTCGYGGTDTCNPTPHLVPQPGGP